MHAVQSFFGYFVKFYLILPELFHSSFPIAPKNEYLNYSHKKLCLNFWEKLPQFFNVEILVNKANFKRRTQPN